MNSETGFAMFAGWFAFGVFGVVMLFILKVSRNDPRDTYNATSLIFFVLLGPVTLAIVCLVIFKELVTLVRNFRKVSK